MKAIVLQHDADAPPELLDEWAAQRGIEFTVRHVSLAPDLDDPAAFDFAVLLGSVAHVDEERAEPWMTGELQWLRRAQTSDVPVFGICFGAQALAASLGGVVRAAPRAEIGWITIDSDAPALIEPGPWYSWHGDVIELPKGAVELARSPVGPQAYISGRNLGVQFHPEVTAALAAKWAASPGAAEELERQGSTQGVRARRRTARADRLSRSLPPVRRVPRPCGTRSGQAF